MIRLCVALFFAFTFTSILSSEEEAGNRTHGTVESLDVKDCKVLLIFERVWRYSPLVERESAIWIALNSESKYEAIEWPRTVQRSINTWSGPLPKHLVAQAHTHGDHLDPKPSSQDILVAQNLRIPVYTLTRKGIWRALPDGSVTLEAGPRWFHNTLKTCKSMQGSGSQ